MPAPRLNFKGDKKDRTANYRAVKYGNVCVWGGHRDHRVMSPDLTKLKMTDEQREREKYFMNANKYAT